MKKFLLLIVGVLFALSANANWTFYVDISGTDWTEAPYFYAGHGETFYEAKQCLTTPVKEKIYQVTFNGWDDLVELYICKSKLVNTTCTKAQIEEAGTQNVDWFGKFATNAGNAQYGFNSDNKKTPLFKLTKGTGGASITVNYDPTDVVYKYSGDETSWNNENGKNELALTDNGDGTYSLTRTFANSKNFGIREYTNGSQTAWYYGVTGSNTISTVGQTYNAVKSDGSNWNFQLTEGEYTLTFNPSKKTIVFTSTSDPTPDPTAYTIYFDAARSSWSKVELTGATATASVAENGLNKFEFSTPGELQFSNGEGAVVGFAETILATGHVYYVEGSKLIDGGVYASYKPLAQWEIRLSGKFCGWSTPGADNTTAPLFTYQGGTTFILYLNNTLKKDEGFKVYDVTGKSGDSEWGTGYGTNGNQIGLNEPEPYSLKKQTNAEDANITPNADIVRPLLTLDVATWTLTITEPRLSFTYAIHGTIIEGNEKDKWLTFTMNKMEGSNYWCYEGYLRAGDFGIIKIDTTTGDQYKDDTNNEIGWIYNQSGTYTIGTSDSWYKAATKREMPEKSGGHNWTLSSDFDGTKLYTIMFNVDKMEILVSTVAPSGVEDVNVDEDAPVEYFNLQGQRVNGELTPGIYIRRQGSTVTKVRF